MTTKNPWLGLASYEEPKNDGSDFQFCGRDEETLELVRLVDNNLFITLYGSSGIGKTSLLRAGVIPILRRKDYFPLYVRLSEQPKDISYAEAIVRKLQESNLTMVEGATMKHTDAGDRLFLWEFFATTRFQNEGREVYPVIILDQFEEVFREGDKAKAELLLKQIYLLLNDELEMPDESGWSADTNYRFVASIREDFLFVLEDSIDENTLDLYKNNRYRLRPMKPEQARQVILVPGKDCIEEAKKDAVAERIIALSKRPQSNDIDTLLLSLVCAGTYDKKSGEKITLADLEIWKSNPMEVYYQDAVKGLPAKQIRYIQQHLIRDDGSRRRMDAEKVKSVLGDATYKKLTQGKNRIFAISDKEQIELLHDQLGMAVYEERKAFEERERKNKLRQRITIISLIVLAIAGFFFFQNQKLKKIQWRMKENQARCIAQMANDLVNEDEPYTAQRMLLQVMPEDLGNPSWPYTPETEYALRTSCYHMKNILADSILFCKTLEFSQDSRQLLAVHGSSINIWSTYSGELLYLLSPQRLIRHASFSPNGENVVLTSDSIIYIWNEKSNNIVDSIEVNAKAAIYANNNHKIVTINDDKDCEENDLSDYWGRSNYKLILSVWNLITKEQLSAIELKMTDYYAFDYLRFNEAILFSYIDEETVYFGSERGGYLINVYNGDYHYNYNSFFPGFLNKEEIAELRKQSFHSFIVYSRNKAKCAAYYDKNIILYTSIPKIAYDHGKEVETVKFSADGKYVIISSDSVAPSVISFEWTSGTNGYKYSLRNCSDYSMNAACSNDGKWTMSIMKETDYDVVEIQNSINKNNYTFPVEDFCCGAFNPDGKSYSICTMGQLTIYDTESGDSIYAFPVHRINSKDGRGWSCTNITSVNYHPNGEMVVTSSGDNTAAIWNVNNGNCIHVLKGHSKSVNSAIFSPNGDYVVTTSYDKTLKVWSSFTGNLITLINGSSEFVYASFSPDGRNIISASADGTICIWDFPPLQELIDQTRERFKNRKLTPEERRKYYLE